MLLKDNSKITKQVILNIQNHRMTLLTKSSQQMKYRQPNNYMTKSTFILTIQAITKTVLDVKIIVCLRIIKILF